MIFMTSGYSAPRRDSPLRSNLSPPARLFFWLTLSFVPLLTSCRGAGTVAADQQKTTVAGCTEGPPVYCADVGADVRPETPMPAPPVNQVFQDPDFGSRMLRVTDARGINGNFADLSFGSNAAGEANEWGKFDPSLGEHGG